MHNLLIETKRPAPPIDLSETLLASNPDDAVVVEISEDSADFRKGDLLVIDRSLQPRSEDFVLLWEDQNLIDRYTPGQSFQGVVTSIIRKL